MEQQELDRHGLCVGSESFQQSFQPYLQSEYPLFITSDSLLNGFHVLLEESLRAAEIRNAILLNRLLSEWRENLPKKRGDFAGDSALIEAGYQRAAWVLEIAQHLSSGTGSLDSETAQELSRIEQAAGRSQSPTLGLDLDYRRFAPTGFYATNPDLSCYYRAVRWLQLVPFRWEHEQEWLAMEMIRRAANPSHESLSLWQDFWALIGEPDNPSVFDGPTSYNTFVICEQRASGKYLWTRWQERVNDQFRDLPQLNARVLPPRVSPDMEVASEILAEGRIPDGNEIWLRLQATKGDDRSLTSSYVKVLKHLSNPPSGCPDFMRTESWKRKSQQTVLAGWAQLLHSWDLHGKLAVNYGSLQESEPGYVEPNPEFFGAMAELVASTEAMLEPGLELPAQPEMAREVRGLLATSPKDELSLYQEPFFSLAGTPTENCAEAYLKLADQLDKTAVDPSDYRRVLNQSGRDLRTSWRNLESLCRRLELLSIKQLHKLPLNDSDRRFVAEYGEKLAGVMLYGGNAYLTPLDDAPRVASFAHIPQTGETLQCAIGRPRALYVMYPGLRGPVLCLGAVLPYYEFPTTRPFQDSGWKEHLDRVNPAPQFYSRPQGTTRVDSQ